MPSLESVPLAELERRALRPVVDPLPSLVMLVRAGVRRDTRVPTAWRGPVMRVLDAEDQRVLSPLTAPRRAIVPDCVLQPELVGRPVAERLDAFAESDPAALVAELAGCRRLEDVHFWDGVARAPRGWMRRAHAALGRAWEGAGAVLGEEAALLDDVAGRIAAADRDALPRLLETLHPRSAVTGGRWMLPNPGSSLGVADAGVEVLPMLASPADTVLAARAGRLSHVYAGVATVKDAITGLEALLGPVRARILRELESARTMSELARRLPAVPSVVTRHVETLERAGLATRRRAGRHVIAERTARGAQLMRLYRPVL
jgi:DNA-binding transcriptional ArsR family regulator